MEELFLLMEKHRTTIEETLKPFIHIEISPADDLEPWNSKFQGTPYLPEGMDYPRGKDGRELFLAAQFNFEEMPTFGPLPSTGMLQFWVNAEDPHETDDYKIIYHQTVRKTDLRSDISAAQTRNNSVFRNASLAYRLTFDLRRMPMTDHVEGFDEKFKSAAEELEEADYDFGESYSEYVHEHFKYYDHEYYTDNGHRMGGYPAWIHVDFRSSINQNDKDFLLFQMDADYDNENIVWGDWGVAFWFINTDALKRRDFSDVLFVFDTS